MVYYVSLCYLLWRRFVFQFFVISLVVRIGKNRQKAQHGLHIDTMIRPIGFLYNREASLLHGRTIGKVQIHDQTL